MKIINKYIFTMTVISSLVVICIYYLPQPLRYLENLVVRVEGRRGSEASGRNPNGGLPCGFSQWLSKSWKSVSPDFSITGYGKMLPPAGKGRLHRALLRSEEHTVPLPAAALRCCTARRGAEPQHPWGSPS